MHSWYSHGVGTARFELLVVAAAVAACGGTDLSKDDGAGARAGMTGSGASANGGTSGSVAGTGGTGRGGTTTASGGAEHGGTGGQGASGTTGGSGNATGGSGGMTAGAGTGGGAGASTGGSGDSPLCPELIPEVGSPCVVGVGTCRYNLATGCPCIDDECVVTDPSCPASSSSGGSGARMAPPAGGDAGIVAGLPWTACACLDTWICR